MSKEPKIRLSAKWGLNPTIPLCPFCGNVKECVVLLGAEGDKIAKELGYSDGHMPMHAHLPGDMDPCKACRNTPYIFVMEIAPVKQKRKKDKTDWLPTGRYWRFTESAIKRLLWDQFENLQVALKMRRVGIDRLTITSVLRLDTKETGSVVTTETLNLADN